MFPMDRRPFVVSVEYDGKTGQRSVKQFPDPYKSKTFYVKMDKEGRRPRIVKTPSTQK